MKKSTVLPILAAVLLVLLGSASAFADDISLALIPATGDVSGPAGSTVGWGYTLSNNTSNWLVTMSLSADVFQDGMPDTFFDFPALAPDASVTVDFVAGVSGLYQLTWDTTAPVGFVNSGTFVLSSDYYNGDPTMGGMDIGPAPDLMAAYSATVSGSTTPEPSAALLLSGGLLLLWGLNLFANDHPRRVVF
jgi:hypothetical protein